MYTHTHTHIYTCDDGEVCVYVSVSRYMCILWMHDDTRARERGKTVEETETNAWMHAYACMHACMNMYLHVLDLKTHTHTHTPHAHTHAHTHVWVYTHAYR